MPAQAATRNRLTLFILWLVFYATFTLYLPPLLDDADSVHAEVAREMLLRYDWITLYANGIRYLEKAPVLYWSMAASFKLFGVSTAAARLPIALTVLSLAILLEAFARRAFGSPEHEDQGPRAGLYAGLILLSSFGIFIFTRITIPDADVCLWLTLALYAFWTTEQQSADPGTPPSAASSPKMGCSATEAVPLRPCLLFATACALNVLTKGLIGIVFPFAIVLAHLLLTRGLTGTLKRIAQLHPIAGILAFLAITAPWHILIGLANPTQGHPTPVTFAGGHWQVPLPTDGNVHGWFWFYFVNEHLLRYLNLRVPRDYDTVPLALFWGLVLIWLMPWSAYLYPTLKHIPLRKILRLPSRVTRHSMADATRYNLKKMPSFRLTRRPAFPFSAGNTCLLLALWAAIPLLFFSLSTRQEYYVLPALPALILLLAAYLAADSLGAAGQTASSSDLRSLDPRPSTSIALAVLITATLLSAATLFFLLHTHTPAPNTDLATLLQQNPGDYALSFGHFLDLNAQALGLFRLPLALTAFALFSGTLAHYVLRRANKPHPANLALAAATFVFLLAAHLGLQTFSPVLSSKAFADLIAPQLKPQDLIILHGEYESGSTLGFYLHRADLHICEGRSSNLWYGSFFPDAPHIFETRDSVAQKWSGRQRIFLWQDPSDRDRPPLPLPAPVYLLARSGGKELLSNQPNR